MTRAMHDLCQFETIEPRWMLDAADPTVDFSAGFDAGDMALNGGASVVSGDLVLTDQTTGSQARSAYYSSKVSVDEFVTRYVYTASSSSPTGGMAFVIQNQSTTALGGTGDARGYETMEPSVALTFALTSWMENDICLYADTSSAALTRLKHEILRPEMGDFDEGHPFEMTLAYDGDVLHLSIADLTDGTSYYLHYGVDIPTLVGASTAWVGFTGGKGSVGVSQEISEWVYYTDTDEIPPVAQFTANNLSPYQSLEGNVVRAKTSYAVAFDAADVGTNSGLGTASHDPDGSISQYAWDFDGNSTTDATGAQVNHTYTTAGTYTATLTVTDDDGHESAPETLDIIVSDSLDAVVQASRTSGVGPLSVHFDATETLGLADGDLINARFAWDFDLTDTDSNGVYERGEGMVATHVYEAPGTYTARLTVTDVDGSTSVEDTTITVSDVDGTWTTYYFASDGDDSDAGTISEPKQTLTHAFSLAGPKVRILLKKGDAWNIDGVTNLSATGPVIVDAYVDPSDPSSDAPVVQAINPTYDPWIRLSGTDARLMNIELRGVGGASTDPVGFDVRGTHNLAYGLDCVGHMGNVLAFMYGNHSTVYGCTATDADAHFVYGDPTQFAIIGNDMELDSGATSGHTMRFQGGFQGYVAHNTLSPECVRDEITVRGASGQIVIYDNDFLGRDCSTQPQNTDFEEYVHHVVFDSNRFVYQPSYEGENSSPTGTNAVSVAARHVVLRNNLVENYVWLFTASSSTKVGAARDVHAYGNTIFSDTTRYAETSSNDYGLLARATTATAKDIFVRNNLVYSTNTTAPNSWMTAIRANSALGTELTSDHNLFYGDAWSETNCFSIDDTGKTLAQWQALGYGTGTLFSDPDVLSTTSTNADFMKLDSDSPAVDAGASDVPVFADREGVSRPQDSGMDMGAFEYTSGADPAPTVSSVTRDDANPTNASSVDYAVTFSESVTGVGTADFDLTTTGGISGASVDSVSGSGAAYTVTVDTGSGSGTIRLDVDDDDSIIDSGSNPLGGTGTGNGDYTSGEVYTLDRTVPTVSSVTRDDTNPTNASSVDYAVTFSESVTGVGTADFDLTTTGSISGASVDSVSGSGAAYTVTVDTGSGSGTIRLDVDDDDSILDSVTNPLGGAGTGNGDYTSGEVYTLDRTAPTADVTDVSPDPRTTAVSSIDIVFSEAVTGVDLADLSLTRDAGANLLSSGSDLLVSWDGNGPDESSSGTDNLEAIVEVTGLTGEDVSVTAGTVNNDNLGPTPSLMGASSPLTTAGSATEYVSFEVDADAGYSVSITEFAWQMSSRGTSGNGSYGATDYSLRYVVGGGNEVTLETGSCYAASFGGLDDQDGQYSASVSLSDVSDAVEFRLYLWGGNFADGDASWQTLTYFDNVEIDGFMGAGTSASLDTSDNITWTLSGLSDVTTATGAYQLTLTQSGSGIVDSVGNALAGDASDSWTVTTDPPPMVSSVTRDDTNPTNASSVDYTVTFSESVTGVGTADFALTTTGGISGASVDSVSGSGSSYTVTVDTGSGSGTIRLDVDDDDSILDSVSNPLGGSGTGNGDYTSGEVYTLDRTAPTADVTDVSPDPRSTAVSSIDIVFSEAVTGLDLSDLSLTRDGGANLLDGEADVLVSWDGNGPDESGSGTDNLEAIVEATGLTGEDVSVSVGSINNDNLGPTPRLMGAYAPLTTTGSATEYVSFEIEPESGYEVNITDFSWQMSSRGTSGNGSYGATDYSLRYVVDGGSEVTLETGSCYAASFGGLDDQDGQYSASVSLSDVSDAVEFRLYLWGGNLADGDATWQTLTYFDNVEIEGYMDSGASLSTSDNTTWTLSGLSGITTPTGSYELSLTQAGSGIVDSVGNSLAGDASDSWTMQ
jgi:PKD repeat protein